MSFNIMVELKFYTKKNVRVCDIVNVVKMILVDTIIKLNDTNKNTNINEKLKDEFGEDVIIRKPFMPKIKIVSVPQYFNTDNNQNIFSSIIEENKYLQNFYDKDKDCMQYIFSYNTNGRKSIIIKCSPEVRRALKEQNDTIIIGQFECKLYDRIHVLQCSNCCKYGHTKKVCKNKTPTCTLCSGSHFYKDCQVKTEDKTCNNCLNHKDINIKEQAGTHHAFSNTCPILKSEKSKIIKRTNFGFSFVEDNDYARILHMSLRKLKSTYFIPIYVQFLRIFTFFKVALRTVNTISSY